MKPILLVLLVVLSLSCKESAQTSLSDPEHFAQLYAKLLIASERYKSSDSTMTPETHMKNVQVILETAGSSQQDLSEYAKGLSDSPDELQKFFDLVNKEIEKHRSTKNIVPAHHQNSEAR